MNQTLLIVASLGLPTLSLLAADPALTIYNEDFAVVRETVPLDLKPGLNDVSFEGTTAHLEPDSVILRDPTGKVHLHILEQDYRNDPVSQGLLLSLFEGKTIDFLVKGADGPVQYVPGKIIRSGYVAPFHERAQNYYGQPYYQPAVTPMEPVIEVDGKIQFGLPGQPIFPSLGDDTILKPLLSWKLNADAPGKLDAELAYLTTKMSWSADYNVVAPEDSDLLDIIGWVTIDNRSGKTFENASLKLMAGDVNKIRNPNGSGNEDLTGAVSATAMPVAVVTEKAFDEYHLYTLPRAATLHDGETKQVEFIRAAGVKSDKIYVYDGLKVDWARYNGWSMENFRQNEDFGSQSQPKITVMREFKNSEENHLGLPLPKGRIRFYRQDGTQLEFTGENNIDHTPKDELVKVATGYAFDLVGERKRTDYKIDGPQRWIDESLEIKVRNHKREPVEIRVVEHLYLGTNWEISGNTDPFVKTNAQEIEFHVQLKPDEEKTVSYKVHYSW